MTERITCDAEVNPKSKVADLFNFLGRKLKSLHPNVITFFSLVFGVTTAYLIYRNYILLSFFTFCLHLIADQLDGCIARHTDRTSTFGRYFDSMTDGVTIVLILLASAYQRSKRRFSPNKWDYVYILILYIVLTAFLEKAKDGPIIMTVAENMYVYKIIFFIVITQWSKLNISLTT